MDIDSIPLGFDYREEMRDALSDNKVMIAVIGPKWLGGRGKDARINANNDPVRIELETAFQQGMRIIPVLVSGAIMPKAADLPQSLQGLCFINAGEVDGWRDFRQHMSRLIHAINQILQPGESQPSQQGRQGQVGMPDAACLGQKFGNPKLEVRWLNGLTAPSLFLVGLQLENIGYRIR
jgi:hypothetical protein